MSKFIVPAAILILAALAQTDATASAPTPSTGSPTVGPEPEVNPFFLPTNIAGVITVPADIAAAGQLAGIQCADLLLYAESKATVYQKPKAGELHTPIPVWSNAAHATGDWATGKCNYSAPVRPGSEFRLQVTVVNRWKCGWIAIQASGARTYQMVARGKTRTDNLSVDSVTCKQLY